MFYTLDDDNIMEHFKIKDATFLKNDDETQKNPLKLVIHMNENRLFKNHNIKMLNGSLLQKARLAYIREEEVRKHVRLKS